jgi:fatty-acyl-CoA synthase
MISTYPHGWPLDCIDLGSDTRRLRLTRDVFCAALPEAACPNLMNYERESVDAPPPDGRVLSLKGRETEMNAADFREELSLRLMKNRDRVLLRILAEKTVELTGSEILFRARALAARYKDAPVGGVVLLLLPHSLELFLLHLGLILEGRIPAILAWPTSRIDPDKYQRNLVHQLQRLPAHQLITLPQLALNLGNALPFPVTACMIDNASQLEKSFRMALPISHLESAVTAEVDRPREIASPGDALFLQFSGGTTGNQKAVAVTASILTNQLDRLKETLGFSERDSVVSWLPLYHDMGLIACLWFPLWNGAPSAHLSAGDWLLNPELLFDGMDRYKGTFCWLPNFAFSYLAAQRERMKSEHSLGHVRGWINCSEPVRLRSFDAFAQTFSSWGVTEETLQASYAMAENVFAVTQTPLGLSPSTRKRSSLGFGAARYGETAFDILDDVYVSSGQPLPGTELRVVDAKGLTLGDGELGDIQFRSESLFSGYWSQDGFLRSSISDDSWYSTMDYGFLDKGDLYVIGRLKDIIIVGGQNVFPEDIESVVNTVGGVYAGRVVAFAVPDQEYATENIAVVAEMRGSFEPERAATMEREIRRLVLSTIGVAPRYVHVAAERWIVKSTAGKISRRETRERFLDEKLRVAEPVTA